MKYRKRGSLLNKLMSGNHLIKITFFWSISNTIHIFPLSLYKLDLQLHIFFFMKFHVRIKKCKYFTDESMFFLTTFFRGLFKASFPTIHNFLIHSICKIKTELMVYLMMLTRYSNMKIEIKRMNFIQVWSGDACVCV